jgi:hypothetical protein
LKQIFNISPGDTANAAQQVLLLRIGERHFSFAIIDNVSKDLVQLTWYTHDEGYDTELQEIYLKHPELRDSFYKTIISIDHPASVLIPYSSYKQIGSKTVLEAMCGVNGRHTIINEAVPSWQLYNVYAVPGILQEWMTKHFPSAQCQHSYSIGIRHINTSDFEAIAMVDFRMNDFTLLLSQANKLLLAQTVPYTNPADVIYFLIKVCKEFGFTQETLRLEISGLVEKESALYRELVHYFLHIHFRQPEWSIPNSDNDDYSAHFFTSLNDLSVCVS